MTHRVVDNFKTIQISKHDSDSPSIALRLLHCLSEAVEKQTAIGQSSQRVELGQERKTFLGTFTINRGSKDICETLQKAYTALSEAKLVARIRTEHSIWAASPGNKHVDSAAYTVSHEDFRGLEASLGAKILHDDRFVARKNKLGLRILISGGYMAANPFLLPTRPCLKYKRAFIWRELKNLAKIHCKTFACDHCCLVP